MSVDDSKIPLSDLDKEIDLLSARLETYGYVSEEFWVTFDELSLKLIRGTREARKQGNDELADKFDKMYEDLKDRAPSGYWK